MSEHKTTLHAIGTELEKGQVPSLREAEEAFGKDVVEANLKAGETYEAYPIPLRAKTIMDQVEVELAKALKEYPKMASQHEGYSVILEELDELWDEIKMKPLYRNPEKLRKEAIQVAAMAIRFVVDTVKDEGF